MRVQKRDIECCLVRVLTVKFMFQVAERCLSIHKIERRDLWIRYISMNQEDRGTIPKRGNNSIRESTRHEVFLPFCGNGVVSGNFRAIQHYIRLPSFMRVNI